MLNSKTILKFLGVGVVALGTLGAPVANAKTFVYVSNAEDGNIDGYVMDKTSGALTSIGKTEAGRLVMPMTLSPNRHYLYAVVRSLPFSVLTYEIDPASGALKKKASAALPDSMAYVSTDATGRYLFTASYGGHKIAVNPISPSGLVESGAQQVIPTGENAHSIRPDLSNRFVFASNLGSSQVLQFHFDASTGKLTPNDPPLIKARPGNGPRHIILSPDNKYVYVSNELSGNVAQFALDAKKGTLSEVSYTASVPADSGLQPGLARESMPANATSGANTKVAGDTGQPRIWTSDLQITPDGKYVYVLERTGSKIAVLSVGAAGKLKYVKNYATETQPRGFRIDPTGRFVVVAGEKSDKISVYKISDSTGELNLVGRYPVGRDANWVEIVDLP
jgi:6-phosphogluconolactonase